MISLLARGGTQGFKGLRGVTDSTHPKKMSSEALNGPIKSTVPLPVK